MILVRIDRIKGDVKITGYFDWFVADSFDFSIGKKVESLDANNRDIEVVKDNDQELTISKSVDSATVYLMHSVMKGRKDSGDSSKCNVDIHLIQNKNMDEGIGMQPFLLIRIEDAIIKDWDISGSGDDRPTETVKIWFNKAAMKYRATMDGKIYVAHGPLGWDGHDNKDFKPANLMKDNY
ncbi:MAG: type VI secretion system tube protein Hcp [Pirellula sp.]